MIGPSEFERVINGKRYSVKKAEIIAVDRRLGGEIIMYRTFIGNYFLVRTTCFQGESDRLEPISMQEAMEMWDRFPEQTVKFQEAFPGHEVVDA